MPVTLTNGDLQIAADGFVLDSHAHPHIVYSTCNMFACQPWQIAWTGSQWITATVVPVYHVGAVAIDAQDQLHLSYFIQRFNGPTVINSQEYAHQLNNQWITATIQSAPKCCSASTIKLASNGVPHIGYAIEKQLMYATLANSQWITEVVDNASDGAIALALDSQDRPHLSYRATAGANVQLKYAVRTGQGWQIQLVDTFASTIGTATALVLDSQGAPHIAYTAKDEFRYARWTGSQWRIDSLERQHQLDDRFNNLTLALAKNDLPRLAYSYATNSGFVFKFAWGELPQHQLYLPEINQ